MAPHDSRVKVHRTATLQAISEEIENDSALQAALDRTAYTSTASRGSIRIHTRQEDVDARLYSKVVARSKTTNAEFQSHLRMNAAALGNKIHNRVLSRCHDASTPTSRLSKQEYSFMLPNGEHTARQLAIFEALHNRPMTVTPAEMNEVIPLELYGPTSGPTPHGSHIYIRTYTFTAEELRDVIAEMSTGFEEVMEWKRNVDLFSPKPADPDNDLEYVSAADLDDPATLPFTLQDIAADSVSVSNIAREMQKEAKSKVQHFMIRYVGTVDWPRNPVDRFVEDMVSRNSGIHGEFLHVLVRLYPEIADAAQLHLVKDASLSLFNAFGSGQDVSSTNSAMREMYVIEYMDHSTLLNRQHGGYFSEFRPTYADIEAYRSLQPSVYFRLHDNAGIATFEMRGKLVEHFQAIQNFANSNADTGTSRYHFTDKLRDVTFQQATPHLYRASVVILAVVGKDVTLDNYLREVSFFNGQSQAGRLTRDVLRELASHEIEYTNSAETWDSRAFNTDLYPFVDLWPWLWHRQPNQARDFLRDYLLITRPLVVASLGKPVNSVTMANFKHDWGIQIAQTLIDVVSVPTIQYYDDSGSDLEKSAFINMPQYHPGVDKHHANQHLLRRLVYMSWQGTQLMMNIMMDIVDSYLDQNDELPSRLALCQEALKHWYDCQKGAKYRSFFSSLADAKQDVLDDIFKRRTGIGSSKGDLGPRGFVEPLLDKRGRLTLAALGQAEFLPESDARRKHLELLWQRNIPDLHIVTPHEEDLKESWIQQFMPLKEGHFLFLHVLLGVPADNDYVKHLVQTTRPDLKDDDSWMAEDDKKRAALLECGLWFHKAAKDVENQRITYARYPDVYATAYDMQMRPIGLDPDRGRITLYWLRDDGTRAKVQFHANRAIPTEGEVRALRFVHFHENGIDILNAKEEPFRAYYKNSNSSDPATIPKDRLAGTSTGALLVELWKAVGLARGFSTNDPPTSAPAKVWSCGGGPFARNRHNLGSSI